MRLAGTRCLTGFCGRYPFKKSYNDTYVLDVGGYDAMRAEVSLEPEESGFSEGDQGPDDVATDGGQE